MARHPRFCPAGLPQHLIQRGNNHSICFARDEDYAAYAHWLHEYSEKYQVAVHAWVLMTNHIHLLATPETDNGASQLMQALSRRYAQYFNYTYDRSGTLWEGRFRSSLVENERYLLSCYRYIEMNPVRAQMVDDPAQYNWSSYHCNGLGVPSTLCTPHEEYQKLGANSGERLSNYRALFEKPVEQSLTKEISTALNKGLALGSDKFKKEIETLYGRRVTQAKMGRPKKKSCT